MIEYVGEHLWAGHLGNGFLVLSFVSALVSLICFYKNTTITSTENLEKKSSWLSIARIAYTLHTLSSVSTFVLIAFMMANHYYEYAYVWQHSSNTMATKYIFAAIWEGQEGSFLIWSLWNSIIGFILMKTTKHYESHVMTVVAMIQAFLATMLLGLYFGDIKVGSNPFLLMREHETFSKIPLFANANYLDKLDGRGLNPLLQNYWMTIHPPTLFLGFALTFVPFVFTIAGLWRRDYNGWQKLALPWTGAGVAILGIGILMGGAWAYEALSFGGFWAWDPVENASLVPWITLVAALHTMIINKSRGGSLFTTHFLSIITFLLILYSTFLTRSGILGNTSVHAFTDLGMTGQLVLFLIFFSALAVFLILKTKMERIIYSIFSIAIIGLSFIIGYKSILISAWAISSLVFTAYAYMKHFPKEEAEEKLWSREFWMFLGSLVLLIAGLIITVFTSAPVINKVLGTSLAKYSPAQYNTWMLPFAVFITFAMAIGQFLKYKQSNSKEVLKKLRNAFFLALAFSTVCSIALYFSAKEWDENAWAYSILFFTALFSVFSNTDYWLLILKGKMKHAGSSIAHLGFGFLLLGALISTSKKITLSKNTSKKSVEALGKEFDNGKSLMLAEGDTLPMGKYYVSYTGKKKEGIYFYYNVKYFEKDTTTNKFNFKFELNPIIQLNERMGNAAEPDTKHFWNRDIYTHVTYAPLDEETEHDHDHDNEYGESKNSDLHIGDTLFSSNALIVLDSLVADANNNDSLIIVGAMLRAIDINGKATTVKPIYQLVNSEVRPIEAELEALGLKFSFWKIDPKAQKISINLKEKNKNTPRFIVLEAYLFPFINILWLGIVIMFFGTVMAMVERFKAVSSRLRSN
jgi:cytochrome c-type biogenesis protein CcmF